MSFVDVANGETILVQVGDGEDPEVFAHDCLINAERGITLTANTIAQVVPNCTNPSAPGKTVRSVESIDSTISGGGKMHSSSVKTWMDWLNSGLPKNIRVKHNVTGSWQVAGSYLLTSFSANGTPKNHSECQVTLEQADAPTISAVSA